MSDPNAPQGQAGSSGSESAGGQQPPKIRFGNPGIAAPTGANAGGGSGLPATSQGTPTNHEGATDLAPAPAGGTTVVGSKKIRAFGKEAQHTEKWQRVPNMTGHGATHVRTFHSKLTDDSLAFMDQVINEWLDQHPEYEVKFVSCSVGDFTGKIREPALICQVWV